MQNRVKYKPSTLKDGTILCDPPVRKYYEITKGQLKRIKDSNKIQEIIQKIKING